MSSRLPLVCARLLINTIHDFQIYNTASIGDIPKHPDQDQDFSSVWLDERLGAHSLD